MVADVIRSCYESKIRPFTDSDQEYGIRWYPAPDGAKIMPDHHLYASSNWVRDKKSHDVGPGEVTSARKTFLTGRNPPCYLGQCRVGSDEAWQNGLSIRALEEPAPDLPECCSVLPCPFTGLSLLGGTTFLYYHLNRNRRLRFSLSFLGDSGGVSCAVLNRDYILEEDPLTPGIFTQIDTVDVGSGPQRWVFTTPIPPGSPPPPHQLALAAPVNAVYRLFGFYPASYPLTLIRTSTGACTGWPSSLTLTLIS